MTAAQLAHLADLANDAARYYRNTHPAWARTLADAAHTAHLAAIDEGRGERAAGYLAALARVSGDPR